MKKQYYILFIVSLLLFACRNENQVSIGDSITKKITIDFDSTNITNNDWHIFNLDKSTGLDVSFSKGKVEGNEYKVTAKEYSKDSKPIIVTLSSNVEGTYTFKLIYSKSSDGLEVYFTNGDSVIFPEVIVHAKWELYIPYLIGLIIIIIVLIIWFIIKQKKESSFDNGYLQIAYPENIQLSLQGKRVISFSKVLNDEDISPKLFCEKKTEIIDEEEQILLVAQFDVFDDDWFKINGEIYKTKSVILNDNSKVDVYSYANEKLLSFEYNND